MGRVFVAPSILAADFNHIEEEVRKMAVAGAPFIHLDVMDGVFVRAKTFGPDLVARIVPYCGSMLKDTHLMVEDPLSLVGPFAKAGSDLITFHYESYDDDARRHACVKAIHDAGLKCGMSIKPATDPRVLLPFLSDLELVLIMSVEPGEGGQPFQLESLQKARFFRNEIQKLGKEIYLEIDGGINAKTAPLAVEAGVDVLVSGSYLYGHDDYADRLRGLLAL